MYKVAIALIMLSSVALAETEMKHAYLKKAQVSGKTAILTLDYADLFVGDEDAKRAIKLGYFRSLKAFNNANPNGIFIRNINPKLRSLKTTPDTMYELVCLAEENGLKTVDLNTFIRGWKNKPAPKDCHWKFAGLVELEIKDQKITRVSQVYLP